MVEPLSSCCGHAADAHDEIGCLVARCRCILLDGGPDRLIELHEVSAQLRISVQLVERWCRSGIIRMEPDETGHASIRARDLAAVVDRATTEGWL